VQWDVYNLPTATTALQTSGVVLDEETAARQRDFRASGKLEKDLAGPETSEGN
jgi:hypothetical protein